MAIICYQVLPSGRLQVSINSLILFGFPLTSFHLVPASLSTLSWLYSAVPNGLAEGSTSILPFFPFFCQPYPLIKSPQLIVHPLNLNKFQEREINKNLYTTPMMQS